MTDDDLPVLPGFREMARSARRRQELVAELVAERRAAGLSQADVADRMGTSQPAVARVEAGAVDVRLSTLERYAAAVGRRLELRLGTEPPAGNAPRGNAPTGSAPTGKAPTGSAPTGKAPTGDKPSGDKPSGDKPSGDKPTGDKE